MGIIMLFFQKMCVFFIKALHMLLIFIAIALRLNDKLIMNTNLVSVSQSTRMRKEM